MHIFSKLSFSRGGSGTLAASLPTDGIARNNVISAFLMGALPAAAGSAISVLLYTFLVWALISLALGRFKFRMSSSDRLLAWTFTFFAGLIMLTGLVGENPAQAPRSCVWLLAFLSPWAIIPRLRASEGLDYLTPYITGAAVGAIAACLIAFVQLAIFGVRPAGGAGNEAVFAMMSLCLMGLGGLKIGSASREGTLLGMIAIGAGMAALLMSLTRGVALAAIPILLLLAIFAPIRLRAMVLRPATVLAFVAAFVIIYFTREALYARFQETIGELGILLHNGHTDGPIGERVRLWHAALEAIRQSPLWGYGIQNRMDALVPTLMLDGNVIRGYTHAHNSILTFMLDGGVLVLSAMIAALCMPVVLAWRAPRDANYRLRLFAALIVSGAYALCGMTQIMFKHDIMDSFFVFFSILIAASIPADDTEAKNA
ncbi:O-antigen ligase family protein [Aquamicrobium terrae]|uniref:O-antigen ligase n=1 Tax=Aquamicrobium terrae TaxID=1324945 RepID=A0ABV2N244_9HYPH